MVGTGLPITYWAGQYTPDPAYGWVLVPGIQAPAYMQAIQATDPDSYVYNNMPAGIVSIYAAADPTTTLDTNWAMCDGSQVNSSTSATYNPALPYYGRLEQVIGTVFGPYDNLTYSLPLFKPGNGLVAMISHSGIILPQASS